MINENNKIISKKSLGTRNKHKGSHAERYYANLFKKLGYSHCITARLGGRIFDNAGIDIINIPFNIQIKAGIQSHLSPGKVLLNMDAQIRNLFPQNNPIVKYPLLLIHRLYPYSQDYNEDLVYMSEKQFNIFKDKHTELCFLSIKKRNIKMLTEYGSIVRLKVSELIEKGVF